MLKRKDPTSDEEIKEKVLSKFYDLLLLFKELEKGSLPLYWLGIDYTILFKTDENSILLLLTC